MRRVISAVVALCILGVGLMIQAPGLFKAGVGGGRVSPMSIIGGIDPE